jgi:hypothetical protein
MQRKRRKKKKKMVTLASSVYDKDAMDREFPRELSSLMLLSKAYFSTWEKTNGEINNTNNNWSIFLFDSIYVFFFCCYFFFFSHSLFLSSSSPSFFVNMAYAYYDDDDDDDDFFDDFDGDSEQILKSGFFCVYCKRSMHWKDAVAHAGGDKHMNAMVEYEGDPDAWWLCELCGDYGRMPLSYMEGHLCHDYHKERLQKLLARGQARKSSAARGQGKPRGKRGGGGRGPAGAAEPAQAPAVGARPSTSSAPVFFSGYLTVTAGQDNHGRGGKQSQPKVDQAERNRMEKEIRIAAQDLKTAAGTSPSQFAKLIELTAEAAHWQGFNLSQVFDFADEFHPRNLLGFLTINMSGKYGHVFTSHGRVPDFHECNECGKVVHITYLYQHLDTMAHRAGCPALGIDCEMVGTGPRGSVSALGRVSIVSEAGKVLLDLYVKPRAPVTDYRTPWSGIRPANLAGAISFDDARHIVGLIVRNKVLVGHDLIKDLEVLELNHPEGLRRDTCKHPKLLNPVW